MQNGKLIKAVKNSFAISLENAETKAADARAEALKNPDYFEVVKTRARLNFEIAEKSVKGEDVSAQKKQLDALTKKGDAILKKVHLSEASFEPSYSCPLCHDTGMIGNSFCRCFEKQYYLQLKEILGLEGCLDYKFSDVDFSKIKDEKQREYLIKLYQAFEKYAEKFPKVNTKNALLSGGTGVGKSCLISAVANRLSERGFNVIYLSAVQLDRLMLNFHTSPVAERGIYLDDVVECDMLIIDDLGSEQKLRNVTEEYLLWILNKRETSGKPVFITTNLSLSQLKNAYNERLFSRMANRRTTIIKEIIGVDLRLN